MTVGRNSPLGTRFPARANGQAGAWSRVSINLWLSPNAALGLRHRDGGIAVESPAKTFRPRLNVLDRLGPSLTPFSPRHAYLSILRVRSWHVSPTIDRTSLQGKFKVAERSSIETVVDELARTRGAVFAREEEGPVRRRVRFSAPREERGRAEASGTQFIRCKSFADITRHATRRSSRPWASIRKAPASFERRSVERPGSLFTFLPIPNINPRQRLLDIPGGPLSDASPSFVNGESAGPPAGESRYVSRPKSNRNSILADGKGTWTRRSSLLLASGHVR